MSTKAGKAWHVDLLGVFQLDAVRAGLAAAALTIRVRSSADDAVFKELGHTVTGHQPSATP
jgi:hypothetical protein